MNRFYTWIDVESYLRAKERAGLWPPFLRRVSAYHDSLELQVAEGTGQPAVDGLLASWFAERFDPKKGLILESVPDAERLLPVSVEFAGSQLTEHRGSSLKPLFNATASLPIAAMDHPPWPAQLPPDCPPVLPFYSFKGGVGRTVQLLAFLKALSADGAHRRALVIDADLEAPGIGPLARASGFGEASFSLVDFLSLAHGDRSVDWAETLALATLRLQAQPLRLELETGPAEHFFLPAFRDDTQALRLDIRFEHLMQGPNREWDVARLIAQLGRAVGATAVLVDLRAGLSELAGPLLLDPRTRRVLVTTPSRQSMDGTRLVLGQMAKLRLPPEREDLRDPVVIVNFVLAELAGSEFMLSVRESLLAAYPDDADNDPSRSDPLPRLRIEETPFASQLVVVGGLTQAMDALDSALTRPAAALLADWLLGHSDVTSSPPRRHVNTATDPARLGDLAKKLEYAESGESDRFLTTPPLRALAQRFTKEPPSAVVIGAKGAGKTFTYLQLVRKGSWSAFLSKAIGMDHTPQWGEIWPLLTPKSLQAGATRLVQRCLNSSAATLKLGESTWRRTDAEEQIEAGLRARSADDSAWRKRWFAMLAASLRLKHHRSADPLDAIVEFLRDRKKRLVVVVDGLEELFPRITENEGQQAALRGLLQGVPARLAEIPNCPLGLVVFVRADLVRAAVVQNLGQFERLYEPYALRWDAEQALRLAVWICREAQLGLPVPTDSERSVESLTAEEAAQALWPVWGRKLGRDESKEARTAEWVIAALSDFRGQIQARDLVRLLRHAAENANSGQLGDRLLPPTAIRGALEPCSVAKISEIEQEIPVLKAVFDKLRKADEKRVPFRASDVGLRRPQTQFLETTGVVLEDEGLYYMPEIFRLGLGFQLAQGARPRVLSLAKRAVGSRIGLTRLRERS
jgi:hypothetical protein